MIILLWIIVLFAIIQSIIAFVNFIYGLKSIGTAQEFEGLISVLIPARNEASNIGNLLSDLLVQNHKSLEIIVFDDQSDDDTAIIVTEFSSSDTRIKLIQSSGLPEGWLGKNFACHQLSKAATGDYFLFLDADVRIEKDVIGTIASKAAAERLSLISIFPRQVMKSLGEWITVPLMNHILLTLLPLPLVKRSHFSSLAAANGQFMFIKGIEYQFLSPHQTLRREKVEDIAMARLFKEEHLKIECMASVPGVSCRMYDNSASAIQGFSKNILHFFGNNLILAISFWIISLPAVLFAFWSGNLEVIILLSIAILIMRSLTSAASHQNAIFNLLLFIPQLIMLFVIIITSVFNHYTKSFQWKGRNIS